MVNCGKISHRFCPLLFYSFFPKSAIHSNKTKTELFRQIWEGRQLWSVGKATSCLQFSICDSDLLTIAFSLDSLGRNEQKVLSFTKLIIQATHRKTLQNSSFCPGTMRSDLWSVRCFGTVCKHHHVPWMDNDSFVGWFMLKIWWKFLACDSFRKCRPKWPSWPMCHEAVCQKLMPGMARPTWQALVMEFSLVFVGTVPP